MRSKSYRQSFYFWVLMLAVQYFATYTEPTATLRVLVDTFSLISHRSVSWQQEGKQDVVPILLSSSFLSNFFLFGYLRCAIGFKQHSSSRGKFDYIN